VKGKALLLAATLLTSIPLANSLKSADYDEENRNRAIDYYGVTGLVIAVFLLIVAQVAQQLLPSVVSAVILLVSWVAITGALHLDGLADCTDAAAAGHANTSRYLEVMKTPDIGTMAVVVVVLQLLVKAVLLASLLAFISSPATLFLAFISATSLSRIFAGVYQQTTQYARENGLGLETITPHYIVNSLLGVLIFLGLSLTTSLLCSLLVVLSSVSLLVCWRRFWLRRIGGYTGDCVGAYIELNEALILLILVACLS